jgi:hypothetical protein
VMRVAGERRRRRGSLARDGQISRTHRAHDTVDETRRASAASGATSSAELRTVRSGEP